MQVEGKPAARRDAAAPALRLPGAPPPLRPLHPRGGGADLRRQPGRLPRGVPGVDGELRPRAHDGAGLQRRLDPAQRRRAVHPHRRDPAAPARQHGPPRRRGHGAARPREHPGLDRHPDAVQHPPGLPADAQPRPARDADRLRRQHPQPRQQGLLVQGRRLHGQPAQGLLGRRGDRRQRLLLRLPAQDHRRPRHLPHRARHDRRQGVTATSCSARTPRSARPTAGPSDSAWPTSTGSSCATSSRSRARRSGRTHPRSRPARSCRRSAARRCSSSRRRRYAEKEGTFTQTQRMLQWREKAVDPPGDCRSELWFFYHLGRMVRERLAGSTDERDRPAARPGVGLPRARRGRARHRGRAGLGRAQRRGGAEGDQRLRGRDRPPAVDVRGDEGRRLDGRRLLDLHRRLRRRRQPGQPPEVAPRPVVRRARVGLGVAAEPPHPLQPRVGRPRRQAVERAQGLRVVGPREGRGGGVDRRTTSPTSRRRSRRPTGRPRGPRASRPSRASTRSSCRATGRVRSTCRRASSTDRCPPTTSRSSRRSATRSTGSRPTRRARSTAATTTR